eukprot:SAG31_NODE_3345_length_4377_cov_3.568256_4_plen_328_part_00
MQRTTVGSDGHRHMYVCVDPTYVRLSAADAMPTDADSSSSPVSDRQRTPADYELIVSISFDSPERINCAEGGYVLRHAAAAEHANTALRHIRQHMDDHCRAPEMFEGPTNKHNSNTHADGGSTFTESGEHRKEDSCADVSGLDTEARRRVALTRKFTQLREQFIDSKLDADVGDTRHALAALQPPNDDIESAYNGRQKTFIENSVVFVDASIEDFSSTHSIALQHQSAGHPPVTMPQHHMYSGNEDFDGKDETVDHESWEASHRLDPSGGHLADWFDQHSQLSSVTAASAVEAAQALHELSIERSRVSVTLASLQALQIRWQSAAIR